MVTNVQTIIIASAIVLAGVAGGAVSGFLQGGRYVRINEGTVLDTLTGEVRMIGYDRLKADRAAYDAGRKFRQ